jgi:cysteinyl-tRNA synthetase
VRLRDSRTGELRELAAGPDGAIGLYVCGPTVYDYIHVGNARPFVVFGLIKRYLEWRGRRVNLIENITDVNDKIYDAANRLGARSDELAARCAATYIEDTDRLGIGRPDAEPLASESIADIIALIEELIAAGHAYTADGDVLFAVRSFPAYGQVSGQRPDQLREGARVEPGEHKRDPLDFALWKATKPDEDTWWESPWGQGRPGWHIECSAMAERHLGREFAVHGGGRDLIFPHHENEAAQSQAAGRPFARTWAHNGMLQLGTEKMSKSLGNIDRLRDALDRHGAETLIMFFLQAHYASPVEYSDDTVAQARAAADTLRNALRAGARADARDEAAAERLRRRVCEALDDDFGTPRALAALFDAPIATDAAVRDAAAELLGVLGLGGLAVEQPVPAEVLALAEDRQAARRARDFARADALRDEIGGRGYEVRDTADGFEVYRR